MRINYHKIRLYTKTLKLRRGTVINIYPTFKCNLNCSYCNLHFVDGMHPDTIKVCTTEEYRTYFERFPPHLIREIAIAGGEPTLIDHFPDIANMLLDMGYHVKIYTNLTNIEPLIKVKNSYRFRITATYHKNFPPELFLKNYNQIKQYHYIVAQEILDCHIQNFKIVYTERKIFDFTRKRPLQESGCDQSSVLNLSPDLMLFPHTYDMVKYLRDKKIN